jgi:hypothetical protein
VWGRVDTMSGMSCQVSESKIQKRAKLKVFLCVCLCCYIRDVIFKDKPTYIHISMVLESYISFLNSLYLILDTLFQFQAINMFLIIFYIHFGYSDGMKVQYFISVHTI